MLRAHLERAEEIVAEARAIVVLQDRFETLGILLAELPPSPITAVNFGLTGGGVDVPNDFPGPMKHELQRLLRQRLAEASIAFVQEAKIALAKRFEILTLPVEATASRP